MHATSRGWLVGGMCVWLLALGLLVVASPARAGRAQGSPLTPAHAGSLAASATFTVSSDSDIVDANPGDGSCDTGGGVCTLRAAIMEGNHTPGGATIHFGLPGVVTYTLTIPKAGADDETNGDLNITNTLTIIGNGTGNTIIDGGGSALDDRLFEIDGGAAATLNGLTLQNVKLTSLLNGAGIYNAGTLTLINCIIRGMTGNVPGGGIYSSGPLVILHSTISGNSANQGGGILSDGGLTLQDSTVAGNQGGGLVVGGVTRISSSTISGNTAGGSTGYGGGIANSSGTLNVVNSTISGNNANANGGGIFSYGSSMDPAVVNLYNVTLTNNQADADFNGSGQGGGVYNTGVSSITFRNTILADNAETALLGVLWLSVTGECGGTINATGYNLMHDYDTSHCTVNGTLPPLADPKLAALASNGGRTQTHALLADSPAIDQGDPNGCRDDLGALLASDQRGYHRPVYGRTALRCDIGAFEYYRFALRLPMIMR